MESFEALRIAIPLAVAFALTHLVVLPLKAFFLSGGLRALSLRAAYWNAAAVAYAAAVVFIFGLESSGLLWGLIKFAPTLLIFAVSIGIWGFVMTRAGRKLFVIDAAVFAILAILAS
jgi:hypothetical protein